MNISCGIIGLPNVGKSTLFNALLKKQAALVANYPFATVEPNIGIVPVKDDRLHRLAEIVADESSKGDPSTSLRTLRPPVVPATVQFVDIAGLVKGAAEGAGLGNKFLSHIREVNVIAHVVRAFTDDNIIREGSSDPENDYAIIQTELMLSDIQTLSKAADNKKQSPASKAVITKALDNLNNGIPIRDTKFSPEEQEILRQYFLITAKKEIVVLNISEDEYSLMNTAMLVEKYANILQLPKDRFVAICAKIESELAALSQEEQKQYLSDLGFPSSGLERLIQKAYEQLGLISFLTAGEKEVRAWTIQKGTSAVDAAGVIHTDFSKNFIKAEVVAFDDFVNPGGLASPNPPAGGEGGWKKARELGKTRFEGRDYIVKDGDVIEFKIGS